MLHPLASGGDVERYAFEPLSNLLLFPYRRSDGEMRILTDSELKAVPRSYAYLRSHEDALRGREKGKMDNDGWYGYVYPKSLGLHDAPKLGVPRLCDRLHASIDASGSVYLDNVDVNGIVPGAGGPGSYVLGCLLNSKLLDFAFKLISVPFRGSFYSANKQFIAPLPVRLPERDVDDSLTGLGRRLHDKTSQLLEERSGFLRWLSDLVGSPIDQLAGRKKLERADELDVGKLIDILKKNHDRLSVDPSSRSFRDRLATEHRSCVEKIAALASDIRQAGAEVDEAVFDLYELTAGERRMVEAAYDAGD